MRQREEIQEVLRRRVTVAAVGALALSLALAIPAASASARPGVAQADTATGQPAQRDPNDLPTRNLGSIGLEEQDGWLARTLGSLLLRSDASGGIGEEPVTQRAVDRFTPYAGRVIQSVAIYGLQAFGRYTGTIDLGDGSRAPSVTGGAATDPLGRSLNALAPRTARGVIRDHMLFAAGDPLDPYALADSERLLRELPFTQDARIAVLPVPGREDGAVFVVVVVRDRWPLGARLTVTSLQRWDATVFHRNVGGRGLDLEFELLTERDREPAVGWRARATQRNVRGTFADLTAEVRDTWDRERVTAAAVRDFVYPDIRFVGGLAGIRDLDRDHPDLPEGRTLETGTLDAWVGWGLQLRQADGEGRRRLRLVPAIGAEHVDYRDPPRALAPGPRSWRDRTRYLVQLNLAGLDYYTTNLVYGYGETEDIPAGLWAALTAGYEVVEGQDRWYHAGRVLWPRLTGEGRFLALGASYGGFRRGGRFEDGILDVEVSGFGDVHAAGLGFWRHFHALHYTLGVNQTGDPLRLDAVGLRDLDDQDVNGTQRLVASGETVFFTPYALFGFKTAAFGYLSGGLIADRKEPLFRQRLQSNLGIGLRLNNPRLVLPTIELRVGLVAGRGDPEPVVTLRMGEVGLREWRIPGARPGTLTYR
jgi:hypothetical protein